VLDGGERPQDLPCAGRSLVKGLVCVRGLRKGWWQGEGEWHDSREQQFVSETLLEFGKISLQRAKKVPARDAGILSQEEDPRISTNLKGVRCCLCYHGCTEFWSASLLRTYSHSLISPCPDPSVQAVQVTFTLQWPGIIPVPWLPVCYGERGTKLVFLHSLQLPGVK